MDNQRVLLVRPIAGHTDKIMERTIEVLERDFVVELAETRVNTYENYIDDLSLLIGRHTNIIGVCQGGMGVAQALMEGNHFDKKVVLIAAPLKPVKSPTKVTEYILQMGLGGMRAAFCLGGKALGSRLLTAYMSMNPLTHYEKFIEYMLTGKESIKEFYEMYFDIEDMSEEFFLEALRRTYFDNRVSFRIAHDNFVLGIAGKRDDIVSVGQMTPVLPAANTLSFDVGHYGSFAGKTFEEEIYPHIKKAFLI